MAREGFKRRLTAILSADVECHSRLMREDEEATVRTITSYRTAMTHLIEQYRGRVVDSPGDNILAEFTSVVDAVNCGVEIQRELAERNAELSENRQMRFRIGINLGDVLEEGDPTFSTPGKRNGCLLTIRKLQQMILLGLGVDKRCPVEVFD
jgi:adenylate cyclase